MYNQLGRSKIPTVKSITRETHVVQLTYLMSVLHNTYISRATDDKGFAYVGCPGLTLIWFKSETGKWQSGSIGNSHANCLFHVWTNDWLFELPHVVLYTNINKIRSASSKDPCNDRHGVTHIYCLQRNPWVQTKSFMYFWILSRAFVVQRR